MPFSSTARNPDRMCSNPSAAPCSALKVETSATTSPANGRQPAPLQVYVPVGAPRRPDASGVIERETVTVPALKSTSAHVEREDFAPA